MCPDKMASQSIHRVDDRAAPWVWALLGRLESHPDVLVDMRLQASQSKKLLKSI